MQKYYEFGPVILDMSFKHNSTLSSGDHFVHWSGTVCAIFIEGIIRNISVKLF